MPNESHSIGRQQTSLPDTYFSEREDGPTPRDSEDLTPQAWGGLVACVERLVSTGGFGRDFPEDCGYGDGDHGTHEAHFFAHLRAEVPGVPSRLSADDPPAATVAMDFLEFCHEHVATAIEIGSYHCGRHFRYRTEPGRTEFRTKVNRILARNGLAFELKESGRVERLVSPVLEDTLSSAVFDTGDATLDTLLESARTMILDPDPKVRLDSLDKLWDAWERVKTVEGPDKRKSVEALLAKAASAPDFRTVLEDEANVLTKIGNKFSIRHSETTQVDLDSTEQVEYLFHRLFCLIWLLLQSR